MVLLGMRGLTLAKEGAKEEQANNAAAYQEMKIIIKSLHKRPKAQKEYYKLNRREQVIIFYSGLDMTGLISPHASPQTCEISKMFMWDCGSDS